MKQSDYTIKCTGHTYISLYYEGKFIHCYDNDMEYMGNIIQQIEKRTKMNFDEIPIQGEAADFNGLRFVTGFKKDWTKNPICERSTI